MAQTGGETRHLHGREETRPCAWEGEFHPELEAQSCPLRGPDALVCKGQAMPGLPLDP